MYHGPAGLRSIALRVNDFASRLRKASGSSNNVVFDTVTIDVKDAATVHAAATAKKINLARVSATQMRVSFDEETTEATFAEVLSILGYADAPGEN